MCIRLFAALLLTGSALAQDSPPVFRGSWTATAGPSTFRGSWSGQQLPDNPNAAQGSWAVLDNSNRVVLQGTWAADKSAQGWQGRWSARIVTGRSAAGSVLSGTWRASITGSKNGTLADMLQKTLQEGVSGFWASGALKGTWGLRASPQ